MSTPTDVARDHDWRVAGEAWSHAAADWACLYEHYAFEVITAIFARVGIGPGVELLDVACGSGLALRHAAAMGARTAGIDAAAALVQVARDRNPGTELRVGSMYELPWAAARFDVVTSINGIWGGCEPALVEACRVLRPGGMIGISFWGAGEPHDLRATFKVFARHAPVDHFRGMKRTNDIAADGVAEQMLADSGFQVVESGSRVSTIEWPDADVAWRALSSTGPALPALQHSGPAILRDAVLSAIEHRRDANGIYRFRGDHRYVIARKPRR
ncbi:class I SAM-dependent methyltransferase [Mycobacterium sp. Y57]|uniref:class I SAM-dependent methyltransferase n=1 Tax=Mycolicibacterium xanthum TaxID=2796469 RepID=UPI001C860E66|nr:class I SAM-dependent methyltransferase [Mycolicibacterium xanthum]MBX7435101.1 class I SAM-dependent methyltransferase [Mycolicibacterium xanthum]